MRKSGWVLALAAMLAGVAVAGGGAGAHETGATTSAAYVAAADAAAVTADQAAVFIKSPPDVERGRALFAGTCGAYCHRMTNTQADAPFLFDCFWIFGGSDQQIFHTITHGVPGTRMPNFSGAISDADIWRIVAYLKSASQCKK